MSRSNSPRHKETSAPTEIQFREQHSLQSVEPNATDIEEPEATQDGLEEGTAARDDLKIEEATIAMEDGSTDRGRPKELDRLMTISELSLGAAVD